jgi:hypothetical protein
MHDGDSTANWTAVEQLTMAAAGYVACVAGDIGLMVHDDGADLGYLQDYDNATRTWWVASGTVPVNGSVMLVDGGSGGGGGTTLFEIASSKYLHGFTTDVWYSDYLHLYSTASDNGDCSFATYYTHISGGGSNISTSVGPTTGVSRNILVRYKTSVAAAGLGLAVKLVYSDGTTEWAFGTDTTPKYSIGYTTETYTITSNKTLDHVRLYAKSEKATNSEYILVDFLLVCQGIFTWPFVSGGVELEGFNNNQYLKIPSKVGNATQYLGADDSTIRVYGDIDSTGTNAAGVPLVGEGWHGRWTAHDAEAFYQILHYAFGDPWQWFTSDVASLKVTLDRMRISQAKTDENLLSYELDMHEYRLGSANVETHLERFGIA